MLAVLLGLADVRARGRTLDALTRASVSDPYPVRAVTRPIKQTSALWRPYMARHRQNYVWQYHNGGIWPMVGGFWVTALAAAGRRAQAKDELVGWRAPARFRTGHSPNGCTGRHSPPRNAGSVVERRGFSYGGLCGGRRGEPVRSLRTQSAGLLARRNPIELCSISSRVSLRESEWSSLLRVTISTFLLAFWSALSMTSLCSKGTDRVVLAVDEHDRHVDFVDVLDG